MTPRPRKMLVWANSTPLERVQALIAAYRAAPSGSDIEVLAGRAEKDRPVICIKINGKPFALLAGEAIKLADIAEKSMRAFPNEPDGGISNLILALRHGAKTATQERAKGRAA